MRNDIPYRDQVNVATIRDYARAFERISGRISFTLTVLADYAEHQGDLAIRSARRHRPYEEQERMDYFLEQAAS